MSALLKFVQDNDLDLKYLKTAVGSAAVDLSRQELHKAGQNSTGVRHTPLAIVLPTAVEQIQKLVLFAQKNRLKLHTVSQGHNIGYGESTPHSDNVILVSLRNMKRILSYDESNGEITVEPGVTQKEVADFLAQQNSPYWLDVTGASPNASVLGNYLEGGFGYTPVGDHRKNILALELVLNDGSLLKTREMPSAGPDLSQLFVQANYGIVTAMKLLLYKKPETALTFTLSFDSEELFLQGISKLKELRQNGVLNSLVHIGNSTRTLMTATRFPEDLDKNNTLSEEDCRDYLNNHGWLKVGAWTAIGTLYGFRSEVKEKRAILRKSMRRNSRVRFFSDVKMNLLNQLFEITALKKIKKLSFPIQLFLMLRALYGIMRGRPSEVPSENIHWRAEKGRLGLIWHAPVVAAQSEEILNLLTSARKVFEEYSFEMPVTMTQLNQKYLSVVFSINFDVGDPQDVKRAQTAFLALKSATQKLGLVPYRTGILDQLGDSFESVHKKVLIRIKDSLDPDGQFSPGKLIK